MVVILAFVAATSVVVRSFSLFFSYLFFSYQRSWLIRCFCPSTAFRRLDDFPSRPALHRLAFVLTPPALLPPFRTFQPLSLICPKLPDTCLCSFPLLYHCIPDPPAHRHSLPFLPYLSCHVYSLRSVSLLLFTMIRY
jgi:hypothetical protein